MGVGSVRGTKSEVQRFGFRIFSGKLKLGLETEIALFEALA